MFVCDFVGKDKPLIYSVQILGLLLTLINVWDYGKCHFTTQEIL